MINKAVFIDVDGTLVHTRSGRAYPVASTDWKVREGLIKPLKQYHKDGFKIILIADKAEIETGLITEREVIRRLDDICDRIVQLCRLTTMDLGFIYSTKEGFNKRPNPGMAYELCQEYELDLGECIMIGKSDMDVEFYKRAGIGTYISFENLL
ncbi:MAG: hypothetical protein CMC35_02800 [Flavobacteriaceae bacterium]|nr:hypothetical protein [Flavobacteriaceae bacterium]|tara:strand:+ start:72 stop:530 length:459 start_codon:yes stop_codon:yes gene_type:complete